MSNTTPPTADSPELKPLQFTLRSMFGVMIALAVLLGLVMQFGFLRVLLVLLPIVLVAGIAISIYRRDWGYVLSAVCIVIVAALLMPMQTGSREAARRIYCLNNLKQIAVALHLYHNMYGSFPPAFIADADGKPMHSWRVLLLPHMEENSLYNRYRFDEPWDGPNNRKLHDLMPDFFRCPSETNTNANTTSYVAVVGPATAWPGTKSTKFSDFSDGTDETILLVEVADSGIHWLEPRDLHVVQMNTKINGKPGQGISSNHPGVACVLLADGSVCSLSSNMSPEILKTMLTIDGGEKLPTPWE